MAQIIITIDTADKSKSSITVDGKKLKNTNSVFIYGMEDPDYMSIEINQYEDGSEEGGLRKMTRLSASAKDNFNICSEEVVENDRKALAEVLLRREINS